MLEGAVSNASSFRVLGIEGLARSTQQFNPASPSAWHQVAGYVALQSSQRKG